MSARGAVASNHKVWTCRLSRLSRPRGGAGHVAFAEVDLAHAAASYSRLYVPCSRRSCSFSVSSFTTGARPCPLCACRYATVFWIEVTLLLMRRTARQPHWVGSAAAQGVGEADGQRAARRRMSPNAMRPACAPGTGTRPLVLGMAPAGPSRGRMRLGGTTIATSALKVGSAHGRGGRRIGVAGTRAPAAQKTGTRSPTTATRTFTTGNHCGRRKRRISAADICSKVVPILPSSPSTHSRPAIMLWGPRRHQLQRFPATIATLDTSVGRKDGPT
mmetsp:Transcript_107789/g.310422  ORF Transcript_107789/g.310422 Transcript_107789/m.310422 type:complete len:274 (-) Transcript_107789:821-1642(-)